MCSVHWENKKCQRFRNILWNIVPLTLFLVLVSQTCNKLNLALNFKMKFSEAIQSTKRLISLFKCISDLLLVLFRVSSVHRLWNILRFSVMLS